MAKNVLNSQPRTSLNVRFIALLTSVQWPLLPPCWAPETTPKCSATVNKLCLHACGQFFHNLEALIAVHCITSAPWQVSRQEGRIQNLELILRCILGSHGEISQTGHCVSRLCQYWEMSTRLRSSPGIMSFHSTYRNNNTTQMLWDSCPPCSILVSVMALGIYWKWQHQKSVDTGHDYGGWKLQCFFLLWLSPIEGQSSRIDYSGTVPSQLYFSGCY